MCWVYKFTERKVRSSKFVPPWHNAEESQNMYVVKNALELK